MLENSAPKLQVEKLTVIWKAGFEHTGILDWIQKWLDDGPMSEDDGESEDESDSEDDGVSQYEAMQDSEDE